MVRFSIAFNEMIRQIVRASMQRPTLIYYINFQQKSRQIRLFDDLCGFANTADVDS